MATTINQKEMIDDLAQNMITPGYWAHVFDVDMAMGERELLGCTTPEDKLSATIRLLDRVNSTVRQLLNGAIRLEVEMEDEKEEEL